MALLSALVLSACSAGAWPSIPELPPTLSADGDEAGELRGINFATVPHLSLQPLWSNGYEGYLGAAISPSGDRVAIYGSFRGRGPGIEVFDGSGELLWRQPLGGAGIATVDVSIGGNPTTITAVAYNASQKGYAYAFDANGQQLWRRAIDGATSIQVSPDGSRFLLLNRVDGSLLLVNRNNRTLASLSISPHTTAQFINEKNMVLVDDANGVKLLDGSGKELWSHRVDRAMRRSVAISDSLESIAITTAGADSSVYMFDLQGKLRWGRQLLLGGSNTPLFSPGSGILYVYNVASNAGVYAFDSASGDVIWRRLFENQGSQRAITTGLWPGDKMLAWDYRVVRNSQPEHWLVVQRTDGTGLKRQRLGTGAAVAGSGDGRYLLVTQTTGDDQQRRTNVRLYDLAKAVLE